MFFDNLYFHNVTELEPMNGISGLALQRFPLKVRNSMGYDTAPMGRLRAQRSTGCEIRFVTPGRIVRLSLTALDCEGDVMVYKGNFFHSYHRLKEGMLTTLSLEEPTRFDEVKREMLEGYAFSSNVWRIFCGYGSRIVYNGIDSFGYEIRPPREDEQPRMKWLAYGSSITHGASAVTNNNSYIQQAARRLGVDVMCNGLSGSCLCEKETSDFLATRGDWDFITLEIGVNMRSRFTNEEFKERALYLTRKLLENNPGKPVILITVFPNYAHYLKKQDNRMALSDNEFSQILRGIEKELKCKDLFLIEGSEILTDISGLSCDLIHPSDYGHMLMGENLARKMEKISAIK